MNTEKRISILLDKETSGILDRYAKKVGVSKSKVIREWILETNSIKLITENNSNKKNINYNFRLSKETYLKLISIVSTSKLTISEVIRALVLKNTNQSISLKNIFSMHSSGKVPFESNKEFWLKGNLNGIFENNKSQVGSLSIDNLVLFIRASTELGNLRDSFNAIEILKEKARSQNPIIQKKVSIISKLLTTDISIYQRNSKWIQSEPNPGMDLKDIGNDRGIVGIYNIQLGENFLYNENYAQAINCYEKALEYLDVINFPTLMIRAYIRLSRTYVFQNNEVLAAKYLNKASEISKRINNKFYYGVIYGDGCLLDFGEGDYKLAEQKALKAIKWSQSINTLKGKYYTLGHYARISHYMGNDERALKFFTEAEALEKQFRTESSFSHIKVFRLYIESKNRYRDSVAQIKEHFHRSAFPLEPSFGKYLLSSAQLNNPDGKQEALEGFREILKSSNSLQIKKAALTVMKTGKFEMIR